MNFGISRTYKVFTDPGYRFWQITQGRGDRFQRSRRKTSVTGHWTVCISPMDMELTPNLAARGRRSRCRRRPEHGLTFKLMFCCEEHRSNLINAGRPIDIYTIHRAPTSSRGSGLLRKTVLKGHDHQFIEGADGPERGRAERRGVQRALVAEARLRVVAVLPEQQHVGQLEARRSVSILDSFLSTGSVGMSVRSAVKAVFTLCVRSRSRALAACRCLLAPPHASSPLPRLRRRILLLLLLLPPSSSSSGPPRGLQSPVDFPSELSLSRSEALPAVDLILAALWWDWSCWRRGRPAAHHFILRVKIAPGGRAAAADPVTEGVRAAGPPVSAYHR
ncbi:hypothetical protein EYF80_040492 [Liparis tanakae]|uniref:Uncharacterized protein n=1 Tax=Liparis tanakae TaxID=230148 RepID=A0A4Z2G6Z3_9TELE|nr:hypothetical protein EYF80_040492 [Liparis tanakae]